MDLVTSLQGPYKSDRGKVKEWERVDKEREESRKNTNTCHKQTVHGTLDRFGTPVKGQWLWEITQGKLNRRIWRTTYFVIEEVGLEQEWVKTEVSK